MLPSESGATATSFAISSDSRAYGRCILLNVTSRSCLQTPPVRISRPPKGSNKLQQPPNHSATPQLARTNTATICAQPGLYENIEGQLSVCPKLSERKAPNFGRISSSSFLRSVFFSATFLTLWLAIGSEWCPQATRMFLSLGRSVRVFCKIYLQGPQPLC